MIKLFSFLHSEFECVDDIHFTAILCAKQCTQNYSIVSSQYRQVKIANGTERNADQLLKS